ncbi:hypothetical protein KUTeg_016084 [Tegillarca granosa]|uniref:Uncharacterized protein n=1 Tax=Tegillarca granosa TaxID=220873 RepID=A0ABQ9EJT9_TEGGR|nr:hypothetical protein KUTeg_016084 [Tegillarca granosa]
MFLKYVSLTGLVFDSDQFLFKPVYRSKSKCNLIHKTSLQVILQLGNLSLRGLDLGLHSLRSGGATTSVNLNINNRCWKRHWRWKTDSSKGGYIVDSVDKRLQVSRVLGMQSRLLNSRGSSKILVEVFKIKNY